jgi:iron(III) transport system ATP-binding protein
MDGSGGGAYLRIQHLTKKFGDFVALQDVSLEVHEGEFVCFLGPSGCGKTTLLRAIAGLDIQTSGTIHQAGVDISSLPPGERDFGIVFQSYALFPNLTVTRNIAYGLENKKKSRAEINERVSELIDLVGLDEHRDKYPAQLSGGQQQRVALARALATSPGLLLLDEPLSALDAKVRVHLRHEIKQLQDKIGVTTIMVTHDQEEALAMADRIVVMNQGFIEQISTPTDVYAKPVSPFVADFIGTTNFIDGVMAADGRISVAGVMIDANDDSSAFAAGDTVTICVRPEDVQVTETTNGQSGSFEVTVSDIEFLGSFYRCHVTPTGGIGTGFMADLSANHARNLRLEEGRTLNVLFPSEFVRVYASGETE